MLILIDFVDFESSVEYYNNYKSNESVHHTKAPRPTGILKSKAPPHGREKLAKAQGCQVMLGGYQSV